MTDAGGTFVISWDQTETDGQPAAGPDALAVGGIWRWDGPAMRIGGGPGPLLLGAVEDQLRLRAVAARKAGRLVRSAVGEVAGAIPDDPSAGLDMAPANGFLVTDGRAAWRVLLLGPASAFSPPPLVFDGAVPPRATDLWIIDLRLQRADPAAPMALPGLAAGTLVATPDGARRAGDLRAGDLVMTRDKGPQPVLWCGHRPFSAAALTAWPLARPIDLAAGAVGIGSRQALRVGPGQAVVLGGAAVADLFGDPTVLVRAADLERRPGVCRAHPRQPQVLVWLLLPDRFLIGVAGGAAVESLDPGAVADTLSPTERAEIATLCPDAFLTESRASASPGLRRLSAGETALLAHSPARHLLPAAASTGLRARFA